MCQHSAWCTMIVKLNNDFNIVTWAHQFSLKLRKHPEFIGCTQQVNYFQITLDCERIKVINNWPTLYRAVYKLHPVQCSPLAHTRSFESNLFFTDPCLVLIVFTWSAEWTLDPLKEHEFARSSRNRCLFWGKQFKWKRNCCLLKDTARPNIFVLLKWRAAVLKKQPVNPQLRTKSRCNRRAFKIHTTFSPQSDMQLAFTTVRNKHICQRDTLSWLSQSQRMSLTEFTIPPRAISSPWMTRDGWASGLIADN